MKVTSSELKTQHVLNRKWYIANKYLVLYWVYRVILLENLLDNYVLSIILKYCNLFVSKMGVIRQQLSNRIEHAMVVIIKNWLTFFKIRKTC